MEYLNTVPAQAEIRAEQFPPERKNFWAEQGVEISS